MGNRFLNGSAAFAIAAALFSPALALAQDSGGVAASSAGDIVVTARKREEKLQDVPVSVTAISGDALEKQGFKGIADIANGNPNVRITQAAGNGVTFNIAIRGNVQGSGTLTTDPSVGTYVDGLLLAHPFGTIGLTVDIANVQTLKGPQGTLFGRNTTGGAMLFATVDPALGKFSGYVQGEAGEQSTRRFGGAINIPIGDRAALRLVYQNNYQGDYQHFTNGIDLGRKRDFVLRGKFLFEPVDGTQIILTAEKSKETLHSTMDVPVVPNAPRYNHVPVVPGPGGFGTSPIDSRAHNELQQAEGEFYSLRATQEAGDGNIKLNVGRRYYDVILNQTLPPSFGFTSQDKPGNRDTSAEIQYNGSLLDNKVELATGLYYFDETIHERQNTTLYSGTPFASRSLDGKTTSKSAYFQATAHVAPSFNVTGGLRYTDDKKTAFLLASATGQGYLATVAQSLLNPPARLKIKTSKLNYLVSADYHPTEAIMLYVSHATGYRTGGSGIDRIVDNNDFTNPNYRVIASFQPEFVKNYEAGFKSQLWGKRLTINGSAYYQDYSNYQYSAINPATFLRQALNADVDIKGFEVESTLKLDSGTSLSANVGLVDAKVASGPSTGSHLSGIPRWTWGASATQRLDVADGDLDLVVNYTWRDSYFSTLNDPLLAGDEEGPSTLGSRGIMNVSATYNKGAVTFAVYADNLTDTRSYNYITRAGGGALMFGSLGRPRVIGARAKYAF